MDESKKQTTEEIIKELNDTAFLMGNHTVFHLVNIATFRMREQQDRIKELENGQREGETHEAE